MLSPFYWSATFRCDHSLLFMQSGIAKQTFQTKFILKTGLRELGEVDILSTNIVMRVWIEYQDFCSNNKITGRHCGLLWLWDRGAAFIACPFAKPQLGWTRSFILPRTWQSSRPELDLPLVFQLLSDWSSSTWSLRLAIRPSLFQAGCYAVG